VVEEEYNPQDNAQNPADLCNRFCNTLDLDQKTTNLAIAIASRLTETGGLAGRSPLSAAAASIYMAGHLLGTSKPAKEIATVVGVSDSTIRGAYKLLYREKETLLNAEIRARGINLDNLPVPKN
jgi:transcription initiation factor TFIIB